MVKKRKAPTDPPDFFIHTLPVELPAFSTGEVAEILNIPIRRLQNFLDTPGYRLSPEGQIGTGRGSRRMFSTEDIYRTALAGRMVSDGFAPQFVGSVLSQLEDYDFRVRYDDEGEEIGQPGYLGLRRTVKGTVEIQFCNKPPIFGQKDSPYYVCDFAGTIAEMNRRIGEQLRARSK